MKSTYGNSDAGIESQFDHTVPNPTFFDKIEEIHYINLAERKEKNDYISALLYKYFPAKKIIRFNAISRENMGRFKALYEEKLVPGYRYFNEKNEMIRPGIIACYLSHYFLLKKIQYKIKSKKNFNGKYFLIFEDDTYFDHELIAAFGELENYLPDDWTMIFGLNKSSPVLEEEEKFAYNKYLCQIDTVWVPQFFGNNLIIYNPEKIDYIVDRIEKCPQLRDYDVVLGRLFAKKFCFRKKYISLGDVCTISDTMQ